MEKPKLKTFIIWQGNKSRHINKFKHLIPEFSGKYIEPFVGSGAMLLYLQPKKWVINDINKDLVNAWKWIKRDPEAIIQKFKDFGKMFIHMTKMEKISVCRKITSGIEKMPYNLKRAIDYLLMKHCSYMGILVYKDKLKLTSLSPRILIDKKYFFLRENNYQNIRNIGKFLNVGGKISNKPYTDILKIANPGDFVFLDPPYIEEHSYHFNYNTEETLGKNFLETLKSELATLDKKGVKWMMTQADTKAVMKTFKGYSINEYRVYRPMRKIFVKELVITNYH